MPIKERSMNEKMINAIGWFASLMAIMMYISYIDQILRNLAGTKGSVILPIVTTVNCLAWVAYGFFKQRRDWPIIVCNLPGIIFGMITVITAII